MSPFTWKHLGFPKCAGKKQGPKTLSTVCGPYKQQDSIHVLPPRDTCLGHPFLGLSQELAHLPVQPHVVFTPHPSYLSIPQSQNLQSPGTHQLSHAAVCGRDVLSPLACAVPPCLLSA